MHPIISKSAVLIFLILQPIVFADFPSGDSFLIVLAIFFHYDFNFHGMLPEVEFFCLKFGVIFQRGGVNAFSGP